MDKLKLRPLLAILSLLAFTALLSACGSGSAESNSSEPSISGTVIKGVMSNAVISLYLIHDSEEPAELLQTVRSDQFGKFETRLSSEDSLILVQVTSDTATRMTCDLSQGCFNEASQQWYAFGQRMPVASNFQLLGVVSEGSDRQKIANVSSVSHLIVSTALNLPGGLNLANLNTAREWVQQALRLEADPLMTPSIDLTDTNQIHQASLESMKLSLTSASFYDLTQLPAWNEATITANNLDLSSVMATASQLTNDLNASFPEDLAADLDQFEKTSNALSNSEGLDIIVAPRSMSVTEGESFYFRVHASSNRPIQYQWYRDGQPVAGATEPVFGHSSSELNDAGAYQVQVDDGVESYFSHSARLWVNEQANPLAILDQPQGTMLLTGQTLTLDVEVNSNNGIDILWQRNGSILPNQNGSTLTISSVTESDAGNYRAIVTDGSNVVYSDFASVYISQQGSALAFIEQPQSLTLMTGQTARFSAKVIGSGFINYQWYKNGQPLDGQYSSQLLLNSVDADSEGSYSLRALNSQGAVFSASASLTVVSDTMELQLLEEPQDADLYVGEEVILRVTALGGSEFNYQWYKNGSVISGANTNTLAIRADSLAQSGSYSVKVSNAFGTIDSRNAVISVSEPPSLSLAWSMPTERENGEPLLPHEIQGYVLEYGYGQTNQGQRIQISGALSTNYTLSNLSRGQLYLRIATVDSDGVVGKFSAPITVNLP